MADDTPTNEENTDFKSFHDSSALALGPFPPPPPSKKKRAEETKTAESFFSTTAIEENDKYEINSSLLPSVVFNKDFADAKNPEDSPHSSHDEENKIDTKAKAEKFLDMSLTKYLNEAYPNDKGDNNLIRKTEISNVHYDDGKLSFSLTFKKPKKMTNTANNNYETTKKSFINGFLQNTLKDLHAQNNGRYMAAKSDGTNAMYIGLGGIIYPKNNHSQNLSLKQLQDIAKEENIIEVKLRHQDQKVKCQFIKSTSPLNKDTYYYLDQDGKFHAGNKELMKKLKDNDSRPSPRSSYPPSSSIFGSSEGSSPITPTTPAVATPGAGAEPTLSARSPRSGTRGS